MFDKEIDQKCDLYQIREAAKKGNISSRTLRYYGELGLVEPDFVDVNGYRYYSDETLQKIPIIKYLKMMNFTLDEIKNQLTKPDYCSMINDFDDMLVRCESEINEIESRKIIISDWKKLLEEACIVLSMQSREVNIKYLDRKELIKYPMVFEKDYYGAILDYNFASFVEEQYNKITGPVMFHFPRLEDRVAMKNDNKKIEGYYIQKAIYPIEDEDQFIVRAGIYATIYHVGAHEELEKTYNKLIKWVDKSEYEPVGSVIERFVADYWSTTDQSKYVTEIIVPVKARKEKI